MESVSPLFVVSPPYSRNGAYRRQPSRVLGVDVFMTSVPERAVTHVPYPTAPEQTPQQSHMYYTHALGDPLPQLYQCCTLCMFVVSTLAV